MSRYLIPALFALFVAAILMSCGKKDAVPAAETSGAAATKPTVNVKNEQAKTEQSFSKFHAKKDEKSDTLLTSAIADDSARLFKHCCTKETFAFSVELSLNSDKTFTFKFIPQVDFYEMLELTGKWKVDGQEIVLAGLARLSLASDIATQKEVVYISFTHALGEYDLTQHKGLALGLETFPILTFPIVPDSPALEP